MRRQELHPRTAVINRIQKNQSKKAKNKALLWLSARFPQIFDNSISIQPLKLGIMQDILEYADEASKSGISRSKLREAVVLFTRKIDYLTCLKAREMRIDLAGNPVAAVTEDEAERAAIKIKKRIEKNSRNSRKLTTAKTATHYSSKSEPKKPAHKRTAFYGNNEFNPHYVERLPMFATQNTSLSNKPAAEITIKHKSIRPYDPEAVDRLREKLGLLRSNETVKDIVD